MDVTEMRIQFHAFDIVHLHEATCMTASIQYRYGGTEVKHIKHCPCFINLLLYD